MSFWDDMKLWEKMLLVLAVAMGATLLFGVGRLLCNKSRIRRARKLEERHRLDLEAIRSELQVEQLKGNEIPFGIRALEAGISVKGVVMSNPSTPPCTSQITLVGGGSDRESVRSQISQLDTSSTSDETTSSTRPLRMNIYQPSPYQMLPPSPHRVRPSSSSSASSMGSTQTSSPQLESSSGGRKTISDYTSCGSRASLDNHPAFRVGKGGSSPSFTTAEQKALTAIEGSGPLRLWKNDTSSWFPNSPECSPPVSPTAVTPPEEFSSDLTLTDSIDDPYPSKFPQSRPKLPLSPYTSPFLGNITTNVPETEQGDLSLLHNHRLSHAAEVGQLKPRRNRILSDSAIRKPKPPRLLVGADAMDSTTPSTVLRTDMVHDVIFDPLLYNRRASEPYTSKDTPPSPSRFTEDLPEIQPSYPRRSRKSILLSPSTVSVSSSVLPLGNHVTLEGVPKKSRRKLQKSKAPTSMMALEVGPDIQQ